MSQLSWDKDGERLFETGVDRVVLYPMNSQGVYQKGVAWNGVTGITESPEGAEANDIYADNIKYLSLISKEDWKGTIKAYTFPDEFNACMGNAKRNSIQAFFGQQSRTKFALSWRSLWGNDVVGDQFAYKVHIAWGLTAAPSEMDHNTENDSPEATEFSWEISSVPPSTNRKIYMGGAKQAANAVALQPCSHVVINSIVANNGGTKTANTLLTSTIEPHLYGSGTTAGTNDPAVYTLDELVKLLRGDAT